HTSTEILLIYMEILTEKTSNSVLRGVLRWFEIRFYGLGSKETSNLLVFKGSICSLTSTTLSAMTTLNPMACHGMAPRSNELSNLYGLQRSQCSAPRKASLESSSLVSRRCP